MNNEIVGEVRAPIKHPIRTNEITSNREEFSKSLWKKDEEEFIGDDYEPIFPETN